MSSITTKKVRVTPQKAAEILGTMRRNRPLSNVTVQAYRDEMLAGEWRAYTDPLKINDQGELIDGQHRLWAVIESETTQDFLVVEGMPDDSFLYLDRGRRRTFADTLILANPDVRNHLSVAATTGMAHAWMKGVRTQSLVNTPTASHRDLLEFFDKYRDLLIEADRHGRNTYRRFRGALPPSAIALAAFPMLLLDFDDATEFFQGLQSGEGLPVGSPIAAMRNVLTGQMQASPKNKWGTYRRLLKAWNMWRRGELATGNTILFKEGGANPERFPEPV